MKISDYFYLVKTRICANKKGFWFGVSIVALSVVIMGVLTTVVSSFASASFVEMRKMSFFFHFYTSDKGNAIYRLVSAVFVLSEIISVGIVLIYLLKLGFSRKDEYRNKLLLGASYSNIIIETLIYNFLMIAVGFVIGGALSYLMSFITCLILGEEMISSLYIYLITMVVFIGAMVVSSIVPAIWVTVDKTQK